MKSKIVVLMSLFTFNVQAGDYLEHKKPVVTILAPANLAAPSADLDLKAKKECFNELSARLISSRLEQGSAQQTESEVVLLNLAQKGNVQKSSIYIDSHNGFSSKEYVLSSIKGVTDEAGKYRLSAYVQYTWEGYRDSLANNPYYKMNCWVERRLISVEDLGEHTVQLRLLDGVSTGRDSYARTSDFDDLIDVHFYKTMSQQNIFLSNSTRDLSGFPRNGMEEVFYIQIPESFWIDDDFEKRFFAVPTGAVQNRSVRLDLENYEGEPYSEAKPELKNFGFGDALDGYSFYF